MKSIHGMNNNLIETELSDGKKVIYESRYQQIAVEMAEKIAEGWYGVGEKITARSTIATTFRVSPETARKAMRILVDMGIVTSKQGSGTYVASREKAQLFFERYHSTVAIAQTKEDIIVAIKNQRKELEHLAGLLDELVERTKRDHNTASIVPHDIKIDSQCNYLGKSIGELNIWQQTGATVVGVQRGDELHISPGPYEVIVDGDVILFVGNDLSRQRMLSLFNAPTGDDGKRGGSLSGASSDVSASITADLEEDTDEQFSKEMHEALML